MIGMWWLLASLPLLIICSAFFSGSETAMLSVNRYRLRHLARRGHRGAARVLLMLQRPDRLLGVILAGNTLANVLASAVMTVLAMALWGEKSVWAATLVLTVIILLFSEIIPKTIAALFSQKIACPISFYLRILAWVFFPVVWILGGISNGLLRVFGVDVGAHQSLDALSVDELRTVVCDAMKKTGGGYQKMLLRILDLEQIQVEDIMVPRNEINGIDITDEWDHIVEQIVSCHHHFVPVYREHINEVIGLLNVRVAMTLLTKESLTQSNMLDLLQDVYFVLDVTKLDQQLRHFQKKNIAIALVVDEYGDVQGMVTSQDILEEVVGGLPDIVPDERELLVKQKDGTYIVDASLPVRDFNRLLEWSLPEGGPRTLSGLVIEALEAIPQGPVCLHVDGYSIEVIELCDNTITQVRIGKRRSV